MSNLLESSPVPLGGLGLVNKVSGNYGPGEYSKLTNVFITPEGTLRKRKPVLGLITDAFDTKSPDKFVGNIGTDVFVAKYDYTTNRAQVYRSLNDNFLNLFDPNGGEVAIRTAMDAVTGFNTSERYYYVEGMFNYGTQLYWIYVAVDRVTVGTSGNTFDFKRRTFIVPSTYNYQSPEQNLFQPNFTGSVYPVETANIVESITFGASVGPIPYAPIVSFMVHKERVLIASKDTVYFSKATDPTKWAVSDDGGFFKFPGKTIKRIVTVGDLIYAIFDSSIALATYGTGPNTDLRITLISEGIGGEDGVLYGDTIFVINYKSIYTVNGSNVSKLADIDPSFLAMTDRMWQVATASFDMRSAYSLNLRLSIFDDGIYFYLRYVRFAENDKSIYHIRYETSYSTYMYRMDLNNGHVSKYTFGYGGTDYRIADTFVSIPSSRGSDSRLYFMHNNSNFFGSVFYSSKVSLFYGANTPIQGVFAHGMDEYTYSVNNRRVCTIPVEIQIKNFSPDGLKYIYRKFRALELQADVPMLHDGTDYLPELELLVEAGIPKISGGASIFTKNAVISQILGDPTTSPAPPNYVTSYKYGVNQRSKSVDITIKTRDTIKTIYVSSSTLQDSAANIAKVLSTLMEIVDLTTLWTPTSKGPSNSSSERA